MIMDPLVFTFTDFLSDHAIGMLCAVLVAALVAWVLSDDLTGV